MEFLIRGIEKYGEAGVAMTFEETGEELTSNLASPGHNLKALQRRKRLTLDYVHVERRQIVETGEYDLEGLFIRLDHSIRSINAKRVVLDTIEVLFAGLRNEAVVRSELRRLFRWLKERGVTAVITAEAGDGKSRIAASFASAACARGKRALYFAFEESPSQILRNMNSLNLPLEKWIKAGRLKIISVRAPQRWDWRIISPPSASRLTKRKKVPVSGCGCARGSFINTVEFIRMRSSTHPRHCGTVFSIFLPLKSRSANMLVNSA
jgi:KaiC/GvpD/RAD55 family RecA-like ATPase